MEGNKVFALDIGTRSVVGLIAEKHDGSLKILDVEVNEHPERSMIGGQIHDVPQVAKIITDIKKRLEARQGVPLKEVAVAAAGRTLLTTYGYAEMTFPFPQEVTAELFYALQLEAIQQAQQQIQEIHKSFDYHCVGFSICHQYLDELTIGNLINQVGTRIAVEIIATFLPRIVLDSLHAAIQKAGLEMNYITLEPIAAMNLAVPENMRQLNIVLVDIGAGTSDIAVSDKGTVRGYAMIPIAGDQVTEALCQAYLLDFPTGEELKKQLPNTSDCISFKDITGVLHSYPKEQVISTIRNAVIDLALQVAQKIIEINSRPPQAVLCIGGGSMTPTLPQELAQALDLPKNRVAIIGPEVTAPLSKLTDRLSYPQAVTPLAIATDALFHRILEIISVTINKRPIRLFATNEATVGDAFVSAGIPPSKYLGRIGPALSLEVNGEVLFIKGQPGQMGTVKINGREGELATLVQEGDDITFVPGKIGASGRGIIADVLPKNILGKEIKVNGKTVSLLPEIRLDGNLINDLKTPISDGCKVDFVALWSIMDAIRHLGYESNELPKVLLNGLLCDNLHQLLAPGDEIELLETGSPASDHTQQMNYLQIQVNGQSIDLPMLADNTAILTDIFKVIDFDSKLGTGKRLLMEVNGETANFITPLKTGDIVTIEWVE